MASVPLSVDEIKAIRGPVVYLLHFSRPYVHAAHYLGFTSNLLERVLMHRAGTGARLVAVVRKYGIEVEVVAIWPGDRKKERALKRWHNGKRLCPICKAKARAQRHQLRLF